MPLTGISAWAFLLTPLLGIVATSQNLFWPNAQVLGFVPADLSLLWLVALGVTGLGAYLQRRQGKLFLIYYLSGITIWLTFAVISLHHHYRVVIVLHLILILIMILAGIWLHRHPQKRSKLLYFSGLFAILLIVSEGGRFALGLWSLQSVRVKPAIKVLVNQSVVESQKNKNKLPNIYHFIFDEYQTDYFLRLMSDELKSNFAGFYLLQDHRAIYGRTAMSLASIFLGREMATDEGQLRYMQAGLNGEESFLSHLKNVGYRLEGVYQGFHPFDYELFDQGQKLKNYLNKSELRGHFLSDFREIWLTKAMPLVALLLLDSQKLKALLSSNFLSNKAPLWSRFAIEKFIQQEKQMDENGRYVFMHVVLPHFPHVLNEDCQFFPNGGLGPLAQSHCTNKLIAEFLTELKSLNRFDQSLIIVQSDHGGFHDIDDPKAVPSEKELYSEANARQRSRALLIIKPAGRLGNERLQELLHPASISDIAPLVRETVKNPKNSLDLREWMDSRSSVTPRHFYFYKKGSAHEWTKQMTKYVITPDSLKTRLTSSSKMEKAGVVQLRNNPKF